jgi:hypothetical protein
VVDELHRYEADHRLDNLIIAPLSRQSFELFTESVLPEFT